MINKIKAMIFMFMCCICANIYATNFEDFCNQLEISEDENDKEIGIVMRECIEGGGTESAQIKKFLRKVFIDVYGQSIGIENMRTKFSEHCENKHITNSGESSFFLMQPVAGGATETATFANVIGRFINNVDFKCIEGRRGYCFVMNSANEQVGEGTTDGDSTGLVMHASGWNVPNSLVTVHSATLTKSGARRIGPVEYEGPVTNVIFVLNIRGCLSEQYYGGSLYPAR
jgi:hypothetical protein